MYRQFWERMTARGLLGVAVALIAAAGLLLGGVGVAGAQTPANFFTTTAVPAGGTLKLSTTGNVTISNVSPISGCPATGIGTNAVTYSCTASSSGVPFGTQIVESFAGTPSSGTYTETITYNANGPAAANPGATTSTAVNGSCTAPSASPGTSTCGSSTTTTTVSGGTLTLAVTGATGQTVQITSAPNSLGNCPLTTAYPTGISATGGTESVTYTCGAGQTIPVMSNLPSLLSVNTTGAAGTQPTEVTTQNANAPVAGTQEIPSPTTATQTFGSAAMPSIAQISPSSGASGTTVTLTGTNLTGATAVNFGTTAGTNLQCNSAGTSCTVTAPNLPSGTAVNVSVVTSSGTSNAFTFSYVTTPVTNVQIVNAPTTGTVGQSVTFSAATAVPGSTGATISSYSWNFGDGGMATGQTVTHVYNTASTYTVTLTVTDSNGATGTATTTITISPSTPPTQPGITVTYPAGWNLVAGPTGTVITGNIGPLYTYQANDTAYEVIPSGTPLQSGQGYWAYFNAPTTVTIPLAASNTMTVSIPSSHFIMIGNATNKTVTVSGADVVYTYTTSAGYQATTTLQPGQGAWAFSYNGGTLTLTP